MRTILALLLVLLVIRPAPGGQDVGVPDDTGELTIALEEATTAALLAAIERAGEEAARRDVRIVLPAGTYTGTFRFPRHGGAHRITLTADPALLPPPGTRIDPEYDGRLPRLASDEGTTPVFITGDRYTFRGLQVMAPQVGYTHIEVGSGEITDPGELPREIRFEQMLLRGDAGTGGHRAIAMNGIDVSVVDSWCDRMWERGRDSQCFTAYNTPGPLAIENTYMEASGENVLLGGARPRTGVAPSGVVIRGNHFTKDVAWRTWERPPRVKNLLELKFARDVTITDNTFEHNWKHAQTGWTILFTTKSGNDRPAPHAVIEDVVFERNVIRDVSSGINIAANDGPVRRVRVAHNVWHGLDREAWGGDGRFAMIQAGEHGIEELEIAHNLVVGVTGTAFMVLAGPAPIEGLRVTHNTFEERNYGLHSTAGMGRAALEALAPGYVFRDNVIVDDPRRSIRWPDGNIILPAGTDLLASIDERYGIIPGSPLARARTSDEAPVGADASRLPQRP